MTHPTIRQYPSQVDRGFLVFLIFNTVFLVGLICIETFLTGSGYVLGALFLPASLWALTFPCRYTLTEDQIHLRRGLFFSDRYRYEDIVSLAFTTSRSPAMALSRDRIELTMINGVKVHVSPQNRLEFLNEMLRRAPDATHLAEIF
ncbi:MAG TPA: PH domain-containing protein [Fimbriimonadaceae bacterium]|nr:PH domain-containing protein [Fimbriimonadaceae bacterium]HRJ32480.1 PH domain-containing protein [Fimbriimonadaceae bacterium]